jgi:hypothetical protein
LIFLAHSVIGAVPSALPVIYFDRLSPERRRDVHAASRAVVFSNKKMKAAGQAKRRKTTVSGKKHNADIRSAIKNAW